MQCWYCKKAEMVSERWHQGEWFRCPECNATWTKPLELGESALGSVWKDSDGISHYHSHPIRKIRSEKK